MRSFFRASLNDENRRSVMTEKRYMISDASKEVEVEPHVLRYWEDELLLEIPRNEMGHRYYREADVETLKSIRELKEKGFQLKAIKLLLPDLKKVEALDQERLLHLRDKLDIAMGLSELEESEISTDQPLAESSQTFPEPTMDKMQQFHTIMYHILEESMAHNNEILTEKLNDAVKHSVLKEINYLFRAQEERAEEHYRRLDKLIREYQNSRQQLAATGESVKKSGRKKLWGRNPL